MDLNEAITGRCAVREYTDEAVDEQTIRRLIAAAVRAPSAVKLTPCGKQRFSASQIIFKC